MKPNVYFIGAGGIGMAALERFLLAKGHEVAGYDRTETELTKALAAEGVSISFDGSPESIPANFTDPETTLVVYTPAVPESLPLFKWVRDNGFEIVKRAKLLGEITRMGKGL
ncbi:MAG: UDP-N-acetylmuramate--L-alanine ligase, partial [Paramuribaculum sp.]|nr:UDP-N-acetylmuramate--L-alanine ligase [Paramuribaculum sp.]